MDKNDIEFDSTEKAEKFEREIQLLLNLVEPDPEYQALFIGDSASLLDCVGTDTDVMIFRLKEYFGDTFAFELKTPLPELVGLLKGAYPGWPDEPFVPAYEAQSNQSLKSGSPQNDGP